MRRAYVRGRLQRLSLQRRGLRTFCICTDRNTDSGAITYFEPCTALPAIRIEPYLDIKTGIGNRQHFGRLLYCGIKL